MVSLSLMIWAVPVIYRINYHSTVVYNVDIMFFWTMIAQGDKLAKARKPKAF